MTSPPVAPLPAPLRCHLLIGPPASGKTTLAGVLAQLTGAVVLSTDVVRAELFGDAAVQCPWRDLRNWLFGFGAGIRIDSPEALRDEHRQKLETALAVYQAA